jgi:uncharacterized protein (TIGR02246 family)
MLRLLILTLSFALLPLAPAAAQQTASGSAADEAAVRDVVRRYEHARDAKDAKAIEALFTADADQHTTAAEWRRGRAQVVTGSLGSSKQNPGDRTITVTSVRFITPDVAIADGPYDIATGGAVRHMWTTIIVKREAGAWKIAAIRNMTPAK